MPERELAYEVLRILDSAEARTRSIPASRRSFIGVAVSQHVIAKRREAGVRGPMHVHGDDAIAAFPDLARAYGEAWDLLVREGLVANDPGAGDDVYVTRSGRSRLAEQRVPPPGGRLPAVVSSGDGLSEPADLATRGLEDPPAGRGRGTAAQIHPLRIQPHLRADGTSGSSYSLF